MTTVTLGLESTDSHPDLQIALLVDGEIVSYADLSSLTEDEAEFSFDYTGPGSLPKSVSFEVIGDSNSAVTIQSFQINSRKVLLSELNEGDDTSSVDISGGDTIDLDIDSTSSYFFDRTHIGTEDRDIIKDYSGDSQIFAGDGNDYVYAKTGNDLVYGEGGKDTIFGNEGNDTLYGGAGNDSLSGHEGDDLLFGGDDDDTLDGGEGDDTLDGGDGVDSFEGGEGFDTVSYTSITSGSISINATIERAVLVDGSFEYFSNIEAYILSDFDDSFRGSEAADILTSGGAGRDTVFGFGGDDILSGGDDKDYIYGGEGNDTISGDDGKDSLFGENGDDILNGGAGDDTLLGQAGDDIIDGGDGLDTIDGGDGFDTVSYFSVTNGGVSINASSARVVQADGSQEYLSNIDAYIGSEFNDSFRGSEAADILTSGGAGRDTVLGFGGDDILNGGDDKDYIYGGEGNDTIGGDDGNDSLFAENGDDTVTGNLGDDLIYGGDGNDVLYGGDGTLPIVTDKIFESSILPELGERISIAKTDPSALDFLGVEKSNLYISELTQATITFREGYAGYNNSLGVYSIAADGTISDAYLLWENVKEAGIDQEHTVTLPVTEEGSQLGFFIIANGGNRNVFSDDMDISASGNIQFIYRYGTKYERPAMIEDNGKKITAVYDDGETVMVLKGDTYHTTYTDGSNTLNPDHYTHAVSGLVEGEDGQALRIGFEDLKNLGDADFNDVVFDLDIQGYTGPDLSESGNDTLYGDAGNDTLYGESGDDILNGGADADTLYGGNGADTFVFLASDISTTDTIADFEDADSIDISDIISNETSSTEALNTIIQFNESGDDTTLDINIGGSYQTIAVLENTHIDSSIDQLISDGTLTV